MIHRVVDIEAFGGKNGLSQLPNCTFSCGYNPGLWQNIPCFPWIAPSQCQNCHYPHSSSAVTSLQDRTWRARQKLRKGRVSLNSFLRNKLCPRHGPMFIGMVFNIFLFGVMTIQVYIYYTKFPKWGFGYLEMCPILTP